MKHALLVTIAGADISKTTRDCIQRCANRGASVVQRVGVSDVAYGRSLILTEVYDLLKGNQHHDSRDWVVVLIDSDMEFMPSDVQSLVHAARETDLPASGVYATRTGYMAAGYRDGVWECGLGFFAFQTCHLHTLATKLKRLDCGYEFGVFPFCQSGVHPSRPGHFTTEDFWLCRELATRAAAPPKLHPIRAGHLKTVPLYPDDTTIERVRRGEMLEANPPEGAQPIKLGPFVR